MNKKTIYLLIPGILNFPGDSSNWVGRGVTHVMINSPHKAEKCEYLCGPISRAFGQKNRVNKLKKTLEYYRGWNIILIGHSNGCAVITEMIKNNNDLPIIKEIHLISGASEADFDKNRFNDYLLEDRIGKINIYVSGKDFALKIAKSIGKFLGYKTLGITGPYKVSDKVERRVKVFWTNPWDKYGHSTCFSDENFEKTMKLFI